MTRNIQDDDEIMDDDEVFLVNDNTIRVKTTNSDDFEDDSTAENDIFEEDKTVVYEEEDTDDKTDDLIEAFRSRSLIGEEEKIKVKDENKKSPIKLIINVMLWLLFIVFVTIVIYVVVNEPDMLKKVFNKIF